MDSIVGKYKQFRIEENFCNYVHAVVARGPANPLYRKRTETWGSQYPKYYAVHVCM